MANLLDFLQPQADAAAIGAANAALDSAASRPFSVVLSVDDTTKAWITALLFGGMVAGLILGRMK